MYGRPFENEKSVAVVLPTENPNLSEMETHQVRGVRQLFEEHRGALERELGAPFEFSNATDGPRWLVGPYSCNEAIRRIDIAPPGGPQIVLNRKEKILVTHGRTPDETTETYSYIRSLSRFDDVTWDIKDCDSIEEAIERIVSEVACSYPAFHLRGLHWQEICAKHIPFVRGAEDPIAAMQKWLAELHDAHTWVRPFPPLGEFPYDLFVEGSNCVFYNIAPQSNAWRAGVRPGFSLLDQDCSGWWERTSSSPHSKPWIVGKRMLSGKSGESRRLRAQSPEGNIIAWEDAPLSDRWNPAVSSQRLSSGNGYLRVRAWQLGKGIEETIDEIFSSFADCPKLIVDLRASPGGNLLMAHRFRNRFLLKDETVGWIQTTMPDGTLSEKEPITGRVNCDQQRWTKPVVFLTDALTYSASEDVLLGLQGQENVKVVGQRSGGGSGRMRLIRLLPGYRLTISTALTFDRKGNCIEGSGVPVDHELPVQIGEEEDSALKFADNIKFRD